MIADDRGHQRRPANGGGHPGGRPETDHDLLIVVPLELLADLHAIGGPCRAVHPVGLQGGQQAAGHGGHLVQCAGGVRGAVRHLQGQFGAIGCDGGGGGAADDDGGHPSLVCLKTTAGSADTSDGDRGAAWSQSGRSTKAATNSPAMPPTRRRLVVTVAFAMAMVAVPVVMAGTADAEPPLRRGRRPWPATAARTVRGRRRQLVPHRWPPGRVRDRTGDRERRHRHVALPRDVLCVPSGGSGATTTATATTVCPTTTTAAPTTTVAPFKGTVTIRQFPSRACAGSRTVGCARSGGRHHEGVDILANRVRTCTPWMTAR